jgi:hypothetical protein
MKETTANGLVYALLVIAVLTLMWFVVAAIAKAETPQAVADTVKPQPQAAEQAAKPQRKVVVSISVEKLLSLAKGYTVDDESGKLDVFILIMELYKRVKALEEKLELAPDMVVPVISDIPLEGRRVVDE